MFTLLKKVFRYSIFDDLVDSGAQRIEKLPPGFLFESSPVALCIENFCIENDSRIYVYDDAIVACRSNKSKLTRIPINMLKFNLDLTESSFSRNSRPFKFVELKLSFGHQVDQYLEKKINERSKDQGGF